MAFEQVLENQIFSKATDKSFVDKLLARAEVERVKELVKKERLTRPELLELLYMCLSTESKLINVSSWDRYVILKFFVWIREFIKVAELDYDLRERLDKNEDKCSKCQGYIHAKHQDKDRPNSICKCEVPERRFILTERTRSMLDNNERMIEHNAKFLIDLYLNILRTTLSLGGTGFLEILNNKYEINYPQQNMVSNVAQEEKKKSWWRLGG